MRPPAQRTASPCAASFTTFPATSTLSRTPCLQPANSYSEHVYQSGTLQPLPSGSSPSGTSATATPTLHISQTARHTTSDRLPHTAARRNRIYHSSAARSLGPPLPSATAASATNTTAMLLMLLWRRGLQPALSLSVTYFHYYFSLKVGAPLSICCIYFPAKCQKINAKN